MGQVEESLYVRHFRQQGWSEGKLARLTTVRVFALLLNCTINLSLQYYDIYLHDAKMTLHFATHRTSRIMMQVFLLTSHCNPAADLGGLGGASPPSAPRPPFCIAL